MIRNFQRVNQRSGVLDEFAVNSVFPTARRAVYPIFKLGAKLLIAPERHLDQLQTQTPEAIHKAEPEELLAGFHDACSLGEWG